MTLRTGLAVRFVSPAVRMARRLRRRARNVGRALFDQASRLRLTSTARRGVLAIDFRNDIGLGARLIWVLNVLAYCDERRVDAVVRFSFPSEPDVDFFGPFFTLAPISGEARSAVPSFSVVRRISAVPHRDVSLERASELIGRYLVVEEDLRGEVDALWARNGITGSVLGVHYRGTDKSWEAPRVDYAAMSDEVFHYLAIHPQTAAIFVSSDEQQFIEHAREAFGALPVFNRADFRRAATLDPVYRDLDEIVQIQRDAVVNCLALARCDALIKTASFLSAFSALLNPAMDVTIVNSPYSSALWFPERELLARGAVSRRSAD